jgi:hypothetical protein
VSKAAQLLAEFFAKQERSIRSVLGAKADAEWWKPSWDGELTGVLYTLSASVSTSVARKQLDALGVDPDQFDESRTLAYLAAVAESNATSINAATRIAIEAALADADDPLAAVGHVFEVAKTARAEQAGQTLITALAGFASVEAVEQVRGNRKATKTWVVTSSRPRSSHASLNGETVPLDGVFSNGAKWPGDSSALDVDEVAGCGCDVVIEFE